MTVNRQIALIAISAALLVGCSGESSTSPPIADSTFVRILADLHTVGAERYLGQPGDSLSIRADYYSQDAPVDSVLSAAGVSRDEYDATIAYYIDRPTDFVQVYNRVLDRLNNINQ